MPTPDADSPVTISSLPASLPPVRLAMFEGPLDLLLHLVRAGRMDIFDLPIATLCDQYIVYLRNLKSRDLVVAGDFLVMAATLIEIKSRMLLPPPPLEESDTVEDEEALPHDPRALLVRQLLEYGHYQMLGETLRERETERRNLFFRDKTLPPGGIALPPPRFGEQSPQDLWRTLQRILATVGGDEQSVTAVRKQKLTLRLTMRLILARVRRAMPQGVCVEELLPEPPFALFEAILLFLALLELMKTGDVVVVQECFLGELRVFELPSAEEQRAK